MLIRTLFFTHFKRQHYTTLYVHASEIVIDLICVWLRRKIDLLLCLEMSGRVSVNTLLKEDMIGSSKRNL